MLNLDIIYELFPKSKFIYIIRDGRDVALSLLEREWGPNNIFACANYWKQYNIRTNTIDILEQKNQLLKIKYEDILDKPEVYARRIYAFLEEPYLEDEMKIMLSSIRKQNFNKWKRKMKYHEIKLFENIAANTLKRFNYETSFPEEPINCIYRWYWTWHNGFFSLKHLIKINTIDAIRIKYFGMEPFSK